MMNSDLLLTTSLSDHLADTRTKTERNGRVSMVTQSLLVRLPAELARRLKRQVPARRRNAFVQQLLQQALASQSDAALYRVALEVEQDERLTAEMAEWDVTIADGLEAEGSMAKRG